MNDPWSRWADEPDLVPAAKPVVTPLGLPSPAVVSLTERRAQVRDLPEQPRLLVVGPKESMLELGGVLRVWGYDPVGPVTADTARAIAKQERVDAALVDVDVSASAYDIVWQLNELAAPCRTVLMGRIDHGTMREAFLVGVVACLAKPVAVELLEPALRLAVEGSTLARACMAPPSTWEVQRRPSESESLSARLAELTLREQEVLELLLVGASTKAMAAKLKITPRTVKYHVTNILQKLGEDSRMALLARLRRDLPRPSR
jgi:DNA-binding NarL/FixJ family response regulator